MHDLIWMSHSNICDGMIYFYLLQHVRYEVSVIKAVTGTADCCTQTMWVQTWMTPTTTTHAGQSMIAQAHYQMSQKVRP